MATHALEKMPAEVIKYFILMADEGATAAVRDRSVLYQGDKKELFDPFYGLAKRMQESGGKDLPAENTWDSIKWMAFNLAWEAANNMGVWSFFNRKDEKRNKKKAEYHRNELKGSGLSDAFVEDLFKYAEATSWYTATGESHWFDKKSKHRKTLEDERSDPMPGVHSSAQNEGGAEGICDEQEGEGQGKSQDGGAEGIYDEKEGEGKKQGDGDETSTGSLDVESGVDSSPAAVDLPEEPRVEQQASPVSGHSGQQHARATQLVTGWEHGGKQAFAVFVVLAASVGTIVAGIVNDDAGEIYGGTAALLVLVLALVIIIRWISKKSQHYQRP